jgi:hypothetical protein
MERWVADMRMGPMAPAPGDLVSGPWRVAGTHAGLRPTLPGRGPEACQPHPGRGATAPQREPSAP